MHDQLLMTIPNRIHADIEDGQVFLIHSTLIDDGDSELQKVWELVGDNTPTSDRTEFDEMFEGAQARIRVWKI